MDIREGYHDRRSRNLTDEDIDALVPAIIKALVENEETVPHRCRFAGVSMEELGESVKFVRNFNAAMDGSKKIVWNTILVLGVGGFITLIGWGIIMKIKELAGIR